MSSTLCWTAVPARRCRMSPMFLSWLCSSCTCWLPFLDTWLLTVSQDSKNVNMYTNFFTWGKNVTKFSFLRLLMSTHTYTSSQQVIQNVKWAMSSEVKQETFRNSSSWKFKYIHSRLWKNPPDATEQCASMFVFPCVMTKTTDRPPRNVPGTYQQLYKRVVVKTVTVWRAPPPPPPVCSLNESTLRNDICFTYLNTPKTI